MEPEKEIERVIIAGVHRDIRDKLSDTTDESMHELEELVKTAGGVVVAQVVQNKSELDPAIYMGEGKLSEIKMAIPELSADMIVFDDELSPVQIRNISEFLEIKVLDRSMLILDIFAMRAKTNEGKLQVELAQLKYRLPRLRGLGVQMSRTGAGIGTRGPGETKLETDRRHIRTKISALEAELRDLKKHRELIRTRRRKDGITVAALVGYTNAGKSTLLNRLTDAGVLAEDKLFATLDPTSRMITLEDNRRIMIVDTVGFIRKLPHHLIEAFKSTLEEAVIADLLIHVIDAANPERDNQIKVVDSVLADIGAAGKNMIAVFNKSDKLDTLGIPPHLGIKEYCATVSISAKRNIGIDVLIDVIGEFTPGKKRPVSVVIPYKEGALVSLLHETQKVLSEEFEQNGTKMELLADSEAYEKLRDYIIKKF
ncbi:MAG: GTPase HflX [Oscillospiraceae bacterium]|nr:GTPase HflX [Oscillospiraceae bacterium]